MTNIYNIMNEMYDKLDRLYEELYKYDDNEPEAKEIENQIRCIEIDLSILLNAK